MVVTGGAVRTLAALCACVAAADCIFVNPWFHNIFKPNPEESEKWISYFNEFFNQRPRKHLSPIDIEVSSTRKLEVPPLRFSTNMWDTNNYFVLNNTGELAEFRAIGPRQSPTLTGGPLRSVYRLDNIHAHWHPSVDNKGTEHSINNQKFAMEFHAVFYNKVYGSIKYAAGKRDGLVVCSFIVESSADTPADQQFEKVSSAVSDIQEPLSVSLVRYNVLLPFRHVALSEKYYHYSGTVTGHSTDPVKWILFKDTLKVNPSQLEPFRKMKDADGKPLFNIRVPQSKRKRVVYIVDNSLPNANRKLYNLGV